LPLKKVNNFIAQKTIKNLSSHKTMRREGKGDKQCLRSSLNFTFILSFFHLAFTIPGKTKEKT
jgi:hypothetical protein